MSEQELHETHPAIIKRLNRAAGHLRSVVAMLEAGRPCLEIAQQLHAVEKAVSQAKKTLIHDHLDHCLDRAAGQMRPDGINAVGEFKEITKFL